MTLRARILTLFGILGVAPIVALGAFNYVRSMEAVEALLEAETGAIARRIVTELEERYALRAGELLLIAENTETRRLYESYRRGGDPAADPDLELARDYLASAWELFRPSYHWIELRDTVGATLYSLGTRSLPGRGARPGASAGDLVELRFPVGGPARGSRAGGATGEVVAAVRSRAILPEELLASSFGRAGYTAVLDGPGDRVVHHASRRYLNQPTDRLLGPQGWDVARGALAVDSGSIRYRERDSVRVASFLRAGSPPWTVVASAAVDEFAPPFLRTRAANLIVMLLVAGLMGLAFILMTRRATASLEQLTAAADDVARGELSPRLPDAGSDEVGRLSRAFGLMVEEVRRMLQRVEETRDMAVMGEFASQISHEIRNPLTSIKLNLQGLGRDVEAGRIPDDAAPPVRISLREVDRLERSVDRVLGMARTHPPVRVPTSVHRLLTDAIEAVSSQLQAQDVVVERRFEAPHDRVLADPEDLEGVFVNLLVNAAEAMPDGGRVRVATATADPEGKTARGRWTEGGEGWIRVRVSDAGPGVPSEIRGQIFRPFVSTKSSSTGFGLALARRAVEAHDGRIDLMAGVGELGGATFIVDLPLHAEPAPAAAVGRRGAAGAGGEAGS